MSRHLSTRNVSSKSMHAFLSNLAYTQTLQTNERRRKHYTSYVVGDKQVNINTNSYSRHVSDATTETQITAYRAVNVYTL